VFTFSNGSVYIVVELRGDNHSIMTKVNIGKELHEAAKHHTKSITEIAEEAGYKQSTFYKHKKQPDLDFSILYKYAKVMDNYFTKEIPEFTKYLEDNGLIKTGKEKLTYEELLNDRDYWKDQAYDFIRKNNILLQQSIESQKETEELRRQLQSSKRGKKSS
jgi:phage repressor protein C with HTH and peptisase S24 domain